MTGLTFNLVESFLGRLIPRSVLNYMNPHFKRATHLLEKLKGSKWSGWTEKIQIVPRGLSLVPPEIDQSVYETVFEAVLTGKQLEIAYQKRTASGSKVYCLNPLGLVFNQEVIYLVATKQGQSEIQQFALHRMASAVSGQLAATIPYGFNLNRYVAEGAFQYRTSETEINLMADFEAGIAKHLYESRLTPNQTLTRLKTGKVRLSATVANSSALKWWLLGFGDGVEVLEPKDLREEFAAIFIKQSTAYQKKVPS
jgi:predicted DNA-binding transcriptional regulator YafY